MREPVGAHPGEAPVAEPVSGRALSYAEILKSTAIIGGSSLVNIIFSIVRNKAIAILLGPAGIGLMGLYSAIADLVQTFAGLGIQASGVRQIAVAAGSGDTRHIAQTYGVLSRLSLLLAIAGALLLISLSVPIADFTFGEPDHAAGVALLAAAVGFRLISGAQIALIQGMRRITDLARINMIAAGLGTLVCVPLVYAFHEQGIVPALIATSAATIATSWWYCRKIALPSVSLNFRRVSDETAALLKLGVAFMASAVLTVTAGYAVRAIVLRIEGIEAAGLYQAAWALGGLYASFILQAMGTDFYPRLTAVASDRPACNRMVNEQTQISLLLGGPGLLFTLTIAPLLMTWFYSAEFDQAANLLRLLCLGMMLRIVAWPMGFIVLAKGAQKMFFWTEVAATVVHVGLAWLLIGSIGLSGAGAAFLGLYVWHTLLILVLARRLSGFRWSQENIGLMTLFLPAAGGVYLASSILPAWPAFWVGFAATAGCGLYALTILLRLLPVEMTTRLIPAPIARVLGKAV